MAGSYWSSGAATAGPGPAAPLPATASAARTQTSTRTSAYLISAAPADLEPDRIAAPPLGACTRGLLDDAAGAARTGPVDAPDRAVGTPDASPRSGQPLPEHARDDAGRPSHRRREQNPPGFQDSPVLGHVRTVDVGSRVDDGTVVGPRDEIVRAVEDRCGLHLLPA